MRTARLGGRQREAVRRSATISMAMLLVTALTPRSAAASGYTVSRDVVYSTAGGQVLSMDVYVPSAAGTFPAVEVLHPGGFTTGDKADPKLVFVAQSLADAGYVAFSINYRLSPRFTFPAQVEDAQAAVRFMRAHAQRYHVDPIRIGAFGASAGGTLAASVAYEGSEPVDAGARVATAVMWSPPLDLPVVAQSNDMALHAITKYVCGFQRGVGGGACPESAIERASPLRDLSSDDPPTFVAGSRDDPLIELFTLQEAVGKIERAGVTVTFLVTAHGHALDYRTDAIQPTIAFLDKHLRTFKPGRPPSTPPTHPASAPPGATVPTGAPLPPSDQNTFPWRLLAVVVGGVVGAGILALFVALFARTRRGDSGFRSR